MACTDVFLFHTQTSYLIVVDDDPDALERALLVGPLRPLNGGEPVPEGLALELLYLFGGVRVESGDAYVIPPIDHTASRAVIAQEAVTALPRSSDTPATTPFRLH